MVKSRRWDCPSCGLDRKRTLAQMCVSASASRIVTLTFEQPKVQLVGAAPGQLRGDLAWEFASIPARHEHCDPATHIAWNERNGGFRWRVIPDCKICCRWVSHRLELFTKRMRRRWPSWTYLQVREVHKSGAVHLHLAVAGCPASMTRKSRAAGYVRAAWAEVGGGFVDVGRHGDHAGSDAGWYVGKYLTKQTDIRFARGFRRWSRAGSFAPELTMVPRRDPEKDGGWSDPFAPVVVGGWVHQDGQERRWRDWVLPRPDPEVWPPAEGGLDHRTANPPHDRDAVAHVVALWGLSRPLAAVEVQDWQQGSLLA